MVWVCEARGEIANRHCGFGYRSPSLTHEKAPGTVVCYAVRALWMDEYEHFSVS